MRKTSFALLISWCVVTLCAAQIPTDYYSSANQKTGKAIRTALHSKLDNHTVIGYKSLENYYEAIDFKDGYVWDIYSTCQFTMADANGTQNGVCDAWNKEHTIPQSWFGEASPMKSDLFHVLPTDACVNGTRSNYPYGENAETGLGLKSGKDPDNHGLGSMGKNTFGGYSVGTVYEPDDQYKGDIARIYFYMMTRYMDRDFTKNSEGAKVFTYSGGQADFTDFAVNLMLKWHRQDPVSQKEIDRNNAVYKVQKNRNPFVDYPYLVEYIWGKESTTKLDFSQLISSEDSRFIVDVSDGHLESTEPYIYTTTQSLTFPTMTLGNQSSLNLSFTGFNLTSGITLAISGSDATSFQVSPSSYSASSANGTHTVSVTYKPLNEAVHNATLTISSNGAQSLTIPLTGACATECEIRWIVNGKDYTAGNPTTSVVLGGKIQTIPTAPTQSCLATSETFVGWSLTALPEPTDEKPTLYTKVAEFPAITGNSIFYAVFAHEVIVTSETPSTLTWSSTSPNANGWTCTASAGGSGSSYCVLSADKAITSPEIDLSGLESITINMRTYGGTQYNQVDITANEQTIGSLSAKDKNMADYTWTKSSSLSGMSALKFTSSTTTTQNGPGLGTITVTSAGQKTSYEAYTTCEVITTLYSTQSITNPVLCTKTIRNGQLIITVDGVEYNAFGQRIK